MSSGKCDYSQYEDFVKKLQENFNARKCDEIMTEAVKQVAARFLARVVKRTPVGDYRIEKEKIAKRDSKKHKKGEKYKVKVANPNGKQGGTLRRGWTADNMSVTRSGNKYIVIVSNPVKYAPYVEYGHRTRNHKGWVEGKFMMTISCDKVQKMAPRILEELLEKKFREAFK